MTVQRECGSELGRMRFSPDLLDFPDTKTGDRASPEPYPWASFPISQSGAHSTAMTNRETSPWVADRRVSIGIHARAGCAAEEAWKTGVLRGCQTISTPSAPRSHWGRMYCRLGQFNHGLLSIWRKYGFPALPAAQGDIYRGRGIAQLLGSFKWSEPAAKELGDNVYVL
jgi:hypothetical protein